MRGFFVCGLLLLALSSVYAITLDTTTTDSPTTTTVTSPIGSTDVSDRSSTTQGSDTLATTVTTTTTTGTSGSPGTKPSTTSGTTQSLEPSTEPQSTPTGQTPVSTPSAKPVTPPVGTTGNPASTTATTTTLLPVTVKKAQVTMTCNGGRCKYLLVVPRLSQTFLDSQKESLDKDQGLFATEEAKYEDLTQTGDVKDIESQFKAINASVYDAIAQYNRIQAALKQIPIDSLYTNSSATKIQSFITTLTNQANTCLYDSCLKPKPTTTTTTTTAPPTTTPNPCQPDSCNCQADCKPAGGNAACDPCRGNLANGLMCVTSTCTAVGTSKAQNVIDYSWLVSPGYNISAPDSAENYGSNLSCEWTLQIAGKATFLALSPDIKLTEKPFSSMDPTAKLSMKCGGFSYTISSTSTASKINGALKACTVQTLIFTLTSGTVTAKDAYFGVQLITQPQDITPTPPFNACSPLSTTTSSP